MKEPPKGGWLRRYLHEEKSVASPGYNRWLMVPPAVATHICLGSVYTWSIMNGPLTKEVGVIASASDDWALQSVVPVFSAALGFQGIAAAIVGKWQEKVGPRLSGVVGSLLFGGGVMLGGAGILSHSLPLLYLGYGVCGGLGLGLAYVPPVAALIKWFPDKRGLATGLTLMGFGGGAAVVTPIMMKLFPSYKVAPEYVGSVADTPVVIEGGRRFVEIAGQAKEVVLATAQDIKAFGVEGLSEGLYMLGTGSTGSGETLVTLGAGYLAVMLASALMYRIPYPGYKVATADAPAKAAEVPKPDNPLITKHNVHVDDVMKTPQFWQIWVTFCGLATSGMGLIAVASGMMKDIFAGALPEIVTTTFLSGFIMALSVANLGGRVLWAGASDVIGRKRMFTAYTAVSVPLYLSIPFCVDHVVASPDPLYLSMFYASTMGIFSFFGACYSTSPAYEADLFGTKFVGAVHGRMLTASTVGAMAGPVGISYMRKQAEESAIQDLASKVDPSIFVREFGAPVSELPSLIAAKSVNIHQLLTHCPVGTVDPTPFLYNNAMYAAAGLLCVSAAANALIRPVNPKYHMKNGQ